MNDGLENIARLEGICLASSNGRSREFSQVVIDSRQVNFGALFVAFPGQNCHGVEHALAAIAKGAWAVVTDQKFAGSVDSTVDDKIILVDCSRKFLRNYAVYRRSLSQAQFIAITGSCGKTATKDLLTNILMLEAPCLATLKNNNNELGVTLTLANLRFEHKFVVIEIGTSYPGEITQLAALVRPHYACITSIGASHLAGLHNVAGVVAEKRNIYKWLVPDGVALLDGGSEFHIDIIDNVPDCSRMVIYGDGGNVHAKFSLSTGNSLAINLNYIGNDYKIIVNFTVDYLLMNARIAILVAVMLGISEYRITLGLQDYKAASGRGNFINCREGKILDHSYNANPLSMRAALHELIGVSGSRVAVLGTMGDMGNYARDLHLELAGFVGKHIEKFTAVYFIGDWADEMVAAVNNSCCEVAYADASLDKVLTTKLMSGATVLFKASRVMALEKIIARLV